MVQLFVDLKNRNTCISESILDYLLNMNIDEVLDSQFTDLTWLIQTIVETILAGAIPIMDFLKTFVNVTLVRFNNENPEVFQFLNIRKLKIHYLTITLYGSLLFC
jgi:hypothetical protein